MTMLPLLTSTGDDRADAILRGAVSLWEAVFPERIRGYYLGGSYANATATPTSDLDLTILFKDYYRGQAESDRAQHLCVAIEALHPAIFVDMGYVSEQSLQQADRVSLAIQLKMSSCLMYGEDIRDQITAIPDARYMRDAVCDLCQRLTQAGIDNAIVTHRRRASLNVLLDTHDLRTLFTHII